MGFSTFFQYESSFLRCTTSLPLIGLALSKICRITQSFRFPWVRQDGCRNERELEAARLVVISAISRLNGDPAQSSQEPGVSREVVRPFVCTLLQKALACERAPEQDQLSAQEASLSITSLTKSLEQQNGSPYAVRNRVKGLVARLSHKFQVLPTCLDLSGVDVPSRQLSGSGGLGNVFEGLYQGTKVAVKHLRSFNKVDVSIPNSMEAVAHEVVCWFGLDHEFVVPLSGTIQHPDYLGYLMVSPWMENGESISYLDRKDLRDADFIKEVNRLLYQVAQGIEYLHKNGIVHGDIRGPNVLIDADGTPRISDFGTATLVGVKNLQDGCRKGALVSRAPELIEPATDEPTFACDIYSFGMLCIELYLGGPPPIERGEHIIYGVPKGRRPPRPTIQGREMPMNVWALVKSCWHTRPCRRPNASQVVATLGKICKEHTG